MRAVKIIILCAFLISINTYAQKPNSIENNIEKHSVSGNILGSSSLFGVTYERILKENFIFEVGVGYVGFGLGVTYYPFKIRKSMIRPYTGMKFSLLVLPEVFGAYGGYIPFGATYFSKHRFNIGLDFGPALGHWFRGGGRLDFEGPNINYNDSGEINVYGNLKVGFRF